MNLDRFPVSTLRGDRTIHRIHRAANGPWWFSSTHGRFDPVGTGNGACYLADDPLGAWLEVFRTQMTWSERDVAARSLLSVQLGRTLKLADLTSRRALQFNVTAQLGAGSDLTASQQFAVHASLSGFDGIRYWVRHNPRQDIYGYAIFDTAGERDTWPDTPSAPLPPRLIDDASRRYGYKVLPVP